MAYFPDLSPYAYGSGQHPNVVHVGWLDNLHDFPRGTVAPHLVAKLKRLALHPVELYRGFHICQLCPRALALNHTEDMRSNGEIRISLHGSEVDPLSPTNVTYAAPVLITHYIEAHGYRPPAEFLKALEDVAE